MTMISHRLSCRYDELCLLETLYPAPLARPFSKGLLARDCLTWAFMPLRRIVPLRGTLSCAFGAALLQGPTRWGLSHMGLHAAYRIVSCSVVMLTRFPTICDYRQTRSPLEKGLLAEDYLIWAFMPLRRIVPLRGTLSCAFGAALLQGPTRWGLSHMSFHAATANCASSRHSILRLWRGPSPRACSLGTIRHLLSCRRRLTICLLF